MTDYPDRPGYSFDPGPPPEASRFLKNKGLRPSFAWEDVEPEEHAVAFTVAKTAGIDLVEAMRAEVQKALDEGLPFKTFQKNWKDRPALAAWLGKREYVDPLTDAVVEIKRSPARRLRVIYDSNLRSARAAGQWERIERTKDAFPYLEYRLGASEVHRPAHVEKAGKIVAVDSPFWDDWMPPNGWGCKCWVRQVTKREAERRGIDAAPDVQDVTVTNPRTGEMAFVPLGIDPGWHRNPGKLRIESVEGLLAGKIAEFPPPAARAALLDLATSWRAARMLTARSTPIPGRVPVGMIPVELAQEAGLSERIIWMDRETVLHFDAKGDAEAKFRLALTAVATQAEGARLMSIENRADGKMTLRVLIPFDKAWTLSEASKASKAARPTALVLWVTPDLRLQSIFPSTDKRFRKDVATRGDKIMDLDG